MATVLITGTSTGIGMSTALRAARAGHRVFAAMRKPDGGSELPGIAAAEKLPIHVIAMDVDDDPSVKHAVDQVLAQASRIDVLVNNAGVAGTGAVEEMPLAEFRRVMETNFFGALRCVQAVLPAMRLGGGGCIINMSSVAGRVARAAQAAYAASKWALEAMSESLAQEVKAFDIRVALVEPGIIATPIFRKAQPLIESSPYPHARRFRALYRVMLQDPVSPDAVAERVVDIIESGSPRLRYLVGEDAEFLVAKRSGMSDEAWVDEGALSDEQWKATIRAERGLDVALE